MSSEACEVRTSCGRARRRPGGTGIQEVLTAGVYRHRPPDTFLVLRANDGNVYRQERISWPSKYLRRGCHRENRWGTGPERLRCDPEAG